MKNELKNKILFFNFLDNSLKYKLYYISIFSVKK